MGTEDKQLTQQEIRASAAARAVGTSPREVAIPQSPVGASTSGAASAWPSTAADRSTEDTSIPTRGRSASLPNASRLRRRVTSSSAAPSMKSNTALGSLRRAFSRSSSMFRATRAILAASARRIGEPAGERSQWQREARVLTRRMVAASPAPAVSGCRQKTAREGGVAGRTRTSLSPPAEGIAMNIKLGILAAAIAGAASAQTSRFLIVAPGNDTTAAKAAVTANGGTVVNDLSRIGVVVAQSTNPNFAAAGPAAPGGPAAHADPDI